MSMIRGLLDIFEAALVALFGDDPASGADDASVLASLTTDDPASGVDDASLLALLSPDDPASGADLAQVAAAASAAELGAVSDDTSIFVSAFGNDDGAGADDAAVSVVVSIDAADTADGTDDANVVEFVPALPTELGTSVARARRRGQAATLGDPTRGTDAAAISAFLATRPDAARGYDNATIKRWPDPRYANPAILAMVAALEDAA